MQKRTRHIRNELAQKIDTENPDLSLEQLAEDDYEAYAAAVSGNYDHALAGGLDMRDYRTSDSVAERQGSDDIVVYGIRKNDELVGGFHVSNESSPEISYWVDKDHLRQRIAAEAIYAATRHMKEAVGSHLRIRATVKKGNQGSRKSLHATGYRRTGGDHADDVYTHIGHKVTRPEPKNEG
ncbi:GNAT family N-acetyltransferase [Candidatus Saccharibacteria bacterium]|nr:GNAT family N-acetyltransferase [Candidatus Saccharibacteria bacterium]